MRLRWAVERLREGSTVVRAEIARGAHAARVRRFDREGGCWFATLGSSKSLNLAPAMTLDSFANAKSR